MMNNQSDHSGSGSSEDLQRMLSHRKGGGDEGSNTDQRFQLEWDSYADAGYDNHRHDNDFRWIRVSSSDDALSSVSNTQGDSHFLGTFTNEHESEFHSLASTEYLSVGDDDDQIIRSENQQVELTFPKMALKLNLDVTVSDIDPATGQLELMCSTGDRTEDYTGLYRNGKIANCEMWLNGQCLQQQPTRSSSSDIELISEEPLFSESESLSLENLKSSSDSKLSHDKEATNSNAEHLQTCFEKTYRLLNFSDEGESMNLNRQIIESSTSLDRLIAWYNNGCDSSFESREFEPVGFTINERPAQTSANAPSARAVPNIDFSGGLIECAGSSDKIPFKEEIKGGDVVYLPDTEDLPSPPSSPLPSSESSEEAQVSDSSAMGSEDYNSPLNDNRPSWLTIYRSSTQFEPDNSNTTSDLSLDESTLAVGGPSNELCFLRESQSNVDNRRGRNILDLSDNGEPVNDPAPFRLNTEENYSVGDASNSTFSFTSNDVQTIGITEELMAQEHLSRVAGYSSSALFDSGLETMLQEVTSDTISRTDSVPSCETSAIDDVTVRHGDDTRPDNETDTFHLRLDIVPLSAFSNLTSTSDSQPFYAIPADVETCETFSRKTETNDGSRETLSGIEETYDGTLESLTGSPEPYNGTLGSLTGSPETNDDTREALSASEVSSRGPFDVKSPRETSFEKRQYETSAFVPVYSLTDILNENTAQADDFGFQCGTQQNSDTLAESYEKDEDSLFVLKLVPSEEEEKYQQSSKVEPDDPAERDRKSNEEKLHSLALSYGLLDDSEDLGGYESYDSGDGGTSVDAGKGTVKSQSLEDDSCDVAVESSVISDDAHMNKQQQPDDYQLSCETGTNNSSGQTSSASSSLVVDQKDISSATSSFIASCQNSEKDITAGSSSTHDAIGQTPCRNDTTNFCSATETLRRLNEHKQSRTFHSSDSLFSFSDQDQVDFLRKFQVYVETLDICVIDRQPPYSHSNDMVLQADDRYCLDEIQVKECNLLKFLGNHVDPLKTENTELTNTKHSTYSTDFLDDVARKLATRIISDISLCHDSTSPSLSDATVENGYSADIECMLSSDASSESRYEKLASSAEDQSQNIRHTSSTVFSCPYYDDISRLDVFSTSVDYIANWPISTMSVNDMASRSHSQLMDLFNTKKHAELINFSLDVYNDEEEERERVNLSDNKYEQSCACDSNTESPVSEEDIARLSSDRYSFSADSGTFIQHDGYDTDKRDTSKGTIMAEVEREAMAQYACLFVKDVISSAHKKFIWSTEGLQERDKKTDISTSSVSESASSFEELVSSGRRLTIQINADENKTEKAKQSCCKSYKCQSDNNSGLLVTHCRDAMPLTASLEYCRTIVAAGLSSIAIRQGMNELRLVACKEWLNRRSSVESSLDSSAPETDSNESEPGVDNYKKYKSKLKELKKRRQRGGGKGEQRMISRPVNKKPLLRHYYSELSSDEASDDDSSPDNDDDLDEGDRHIFEALHRENNETTISEIEIILDTETMLLKAKQEHHLRRLERYRKKVESSAPSALCPDHHDSLPPSTQSQTCWCNVENAEALRNIAFEILRGRQLLRTQQCISKMEDELVAMRKRINTGEKAVFNMKSLNSPLFRNSEDQAKLLMQTETEALKTLVFKKVEDIENTIQGRLYSGDDHPKDVTTFGRIINQEMKEFKDAVIFTWEEIQDQAKYVVENCFIPEENENSVQNNINRSEQPEEHKQQAKKCSEQSEHIITEGSVHAPYDGISKLTRIAEKASRLDVSRQFLTDEYKQLKDNRLGVDLSTQPLTELNSANGEFPPLVTPRCSICKLRKKVNSANNSEVCKKSQTNNIIQTKKDSSSTIKRFGGHEYEVVTGCGIRKHTMTCALCKAMEDNGV